MKLITFAHQSGSNGKVNDGEIGRLAHGRFSRDMIAGFIGTTDGSGWQMAPIARSI